MGNCRVFLFSFLYRFAHDFKMVGKEHAYYFGNIGYKMYGVECSHTQTANNLKPFKMEETIKQIADHITANTIFCTKEVLTSDETANYLGISKSYLYKLTTRQEIPHYKPMGKMCYFNRLEIEQWAQKNRISTQEEINQIAQTYCMKKGGQNEHSKH